MRLRNRVFGFLAAVCCTAALTAVPATADTGQTLGDVTAFEAEGPTYTFGVGEAKVRVSFYRPDMFRIWLAPDGVFADPANTPPSDPEAPDENIIVSTDFGPVATTWSDAGGYYLLQTDSMSVRAYKEPLRFALYDASNSQLVWEERQGLTYDGGAYHQSLSRGPREQFFGGGMQNGRFSHRDQTIGVRRNRNWSDGGNPNQAAFYMSTRGYGVFRNTFAPGAYSFTDPVVASHEENRFDAFYFMGGLKQVLEGYTALTGRPFLPPIYGLELGDADCYRSLTSTSLSPYRSPEKVETRDAIKVAEQYVDHDMPRGWMLVNDGYNCGYNDLEYVSDELRRRKIDLGLWTENGVPDQEYEVGEAGVRVRKLDVAWVGPGYRFALDACQTAYDGIERFSDARGFVWMVEGWSGAQRCAVQWTGDHSGSLDAIRWQIPAIHGSGLSGVAWTAGDIDGIFGGSAKSYVRDLQWKVFNPALITMSGWAANDKQPWRFGEPYTSINRRYLKLRERLLPFFYTYAAEAHRTGVPPIRSLVLEYPSDPKTWGGDATYEFLAGREFLVAPVYQDREVRDGIYLPKGTWVDYWTGKVYEGSATLDGHAAPLDRLPLFVKAGAIVPMWPDGINNHRDRTPGSRITFDIYPQGDSTFTLYEDDMVTRKHRDGEFAEQTINVSAPEHGTGDVVVDVGASVGTYAGKRGLRPYEMGVHTVTEPTGVRLGNRWLPSLADRADYDVATHGWYYDAQDRGGVAHVKTPSQPTGQGFRVRLKDITAIGASQGDRPVLALQPPDVVEPGKPDPVSVVLRAGAEPVRDASVSVTAPAGWEVEAVSPTQLDLIAPGTQVTTTFEVTPPKESPPGAAQLGATARFTLGTARSTVSDTQQVIVMPAPTGRAYASDLPWLEASSSFGQVQRDRSIGFLRDGSAGHPGLMVGGILYPKGLGTHADSTVRYYLGGACSRFTANVGVDGEAPSGSVEFTVYADEEPVFQSDTLTGIAAESVDADITGAEVLTLIVTDGGDGIGSDHADWADARLTCAT